MVPTQDARSISHKLSLGKPLFWLNPACTHDAPQPELQEIEAAAARLQRCAPLLARLFPELAAANGLIESPLLAVPALQQALALPGTLLLKADHDLPIAGSVKARGGFHEVLCHAESLALGAGILHSTDDDYLKLAVPAPASSNRPTRKRKGPRCVTPQPLTNCRSLRDHSASCTPPQWH
jgi:D-serine dehydratase